MAEYLRFSTNVPEEVALRFPEGKQVSSKIEGGADQMMYSLADGRVMYVPLHVADQIRELRIGPGERFNLGKFEVKEGNRRFIRWQLGRVDPDPRWQQPAPSGPNGSGTAASSRAAKPGEEAPAPASANTPAQTNTPTNGIGTAKPPVNGNGHAVHNGIPCWDPKADLRHCYEDAIEVLVAAGDIAAGKGLPVQFTGDDLRQVAATLYIDAGKDRRCPNGGAR
jgi:hypothetical protein